MKSHSVDKIIMGGVFILFGILFAAKAFDVFDFTKSFPGWWTLIIFIPSIFGVLRKSTRIIGIFGMAFGSILLLCACGVISWRHLPVITISLLLIVIGIIFMIATPKHKEKEKVKSCYSEYDCHYREQRTYSKEYEEQNSNAKNNNTESNTTGQKHKYQEQYSDIKGENLTQLNAYLIGKVFEPKNEIFTGTHINCILGNVQLDLRNAIINENITIDVTLLLGGVDLYLPSNVHVVQSCQSILGEVRDLSGYTLKQQANVPIVKITGNCILGGLELK